MIDLGVWVEAVPSTVLATSALVLPGSVLSSAAGVQLRRWPVTVPLLSMAIIALAPVPSALVGLPWGWGALTIWVLVIAALLVGCRIAAGHNVKGTLPWANITWRLRLTPSRVAALILFPIASLLSAYAYMAAIGTPTQPPQTWDAVFHLGAVRWILDTGNGSTLSLGGVANVDASPAFYPAGWHDLVTLAYTGDVVVATHGVILVVAALLWPLGATMLASRLLPNNPWVWSVTALVASSYTSMPERPSSYGTLWPTVLAYALIPFLIALVIEMLDEKTPDRFTLLGLCAAAAAGLAICHPSAVIASLVILFPALILHGVALLRGRVDASRAWKMTYCALLIMLVAGVVLLFNSPLMRSVANYDRSGSSQWTTELWGALVDAQLSGAGHGNSEPAYLLMVLSILGAVCVLGVAGRRFVAVSWIVLVLLYVESVVLADSFRIVVGPWYSDAVRVGALVPLLAAPLGGAALAWLIHKSASLPFAWASRWGVAAQVLTLVVCVGALDWDTQRFGLTLGAHQLAINYDRSEAEGLNSLISDGELEMMRRLPQELPEDARIIGDPMNGSAMLYGISGLNAVYKHLSGKNTADIYTASVNFAHIEQDPRVCEILNRHNIHYYYSDQRVYWPEKAEADRVSVGLREVGNITDRFELIDTGGGAALWRIATCDPMSK